MGEVRATPPKPISELAREWDALAVRRHHQISSGQDLSFRLVLAPLMLELLGGCDTESVLDIGCGTGDLTALVAKQAGSVMGVDLSQASIEIARSSLPSKNVGFMVGSLEGLLSALHQTRFTCALAGMTLMTVPDLDTFVQALDSILSPGQRFAATMAHPWFWPRYWQYEDEDWFSYSAEIFIEAPFRISTDETEIVTTHVHRPLERYLSAFESRGFVLEVLREPLPEPDAIRGVQAPWEYPRFLGLRWRKAV